MTLTDQSRRVRGRVVAATVLVAASLVVGACGDDGELAGQPGDAVATPVTSPAQTTTSPATGEDYFANDTYVGRTVTVTAAVDQVLDGRALVLNGAQYGDDSLLVLAPPEQADVAKGDIVTVTGTVRTFTFDEYRERYGLVDATLYEVYADEEFLEAEQIEKTTPSPTPTT